jgi:hypothetical protein
MKLPYLKPLVAVAVSVLAVVVDVAHVLAGAHLVPGGVD